MSMPVTQHEPQNIKRMPQEQSVRDAVRLAAVHARIISPTREELERAAGAILAQLALPLDYLGFAMVAVSNVYWQARFEAVPFERRLLLLPHCLSDHDACKGDYDSVGLHCNGCGKCEIVHLQIAAENLGYQVIVAEGTSSVLMKIIDGEADAILGVACLDSLEKSFARIVELGIPHLAVPLLTDGCANTEAENEQITAWLHAERETAEPAGSSYLPLLRETRRVFQPSVLSRTLAPVLTADAVDPLTATDAMAMDWLLEGGKRLRPFVTLAAYAVGLHGAEALAADADMAAIIPPAMQRVAVAIEALHKASLVHDDIEDNDAVRYGKPTLHQQYGLAPAINIGDFLVGLGYRLIAGETSALGAPCTADILTHLSTAHLDLCRGQGAELLWQNRQAINLRPIDALSIYALKTAPAFEAALYAGLRAANATVDATLLKRFAIYLGEAYQVQDDLDDWEGEDIHQLGRDVLAGRPTVLRAFALQAGGQEALAQRLVAIDAPADALIAEVGQLYADLGAFTQAERLWMKLRTRALDLAGEIEAPALRELFAFLVRMVLPETPRGPRTYAR